MEHTQIDQLGAELYEALTQRRMLEPLTNRHPGITIEDAYAIQQRMLARRLAAGEKVVGKKIGVTSQAVMDMLGVFQPDFGWLTDGMVYNEGQAIPAPLVMPVASPDNGESPPSQIFFASGNLEIAEPTAGFAAGDIVLVELIIDADIASVTGTASTP